jgi:transposase
LPAAVEVSDFAVEEDFIDAKVRIVTRRCNLPKPYVKRHKNDATDAEAICEAVTRPNTRFVATKTPEQQSCLTLRARAICSFASKP